jgi:hypothetical protein
MKAIPKDANLVTVIDVFSIARKGKLNEISDLKLFRTAKKELKNENKKMSVLMDVLIEDPTISGINFTSDVFAFYVNEAKDEQFTCISAELSDSKEFATLLITTLNDIEIEYNIETKNEISYIVLKDIALGWDNDKVIFLSSLNYKSRENLGFEVENILSLKEENQISANQDFNNFYNNKKDVSLWLSTDMFEDMREIKGFSI